MARIWTACVVLLLVGKASAVAAASVEELLEENRMLRSRLTALQQQLSDPSDAFDDHDEHLHANGKHGCCVPHFDFCCPFEDHHGGHGNSDLCGCNYGKHRNGHGHHVGHEYGPAYHHSIDGYPILHAARTEFFFVERHVHLRLVEARGSDGGEIDELEFEAELIYALNDRFVFIGAIPVIHLNPLFAPSTTGIGDLEFGLRMMAFNGERDGILFGLDVVTPTGDPDRDLGGDTLLLPSANWVHDFGSGTYMFNVAAWEMPIDVDQPEDLFLYNFVLLHTFLGTEDAAFFRYLTPSFEINTEVIINGPAAGHGVVDATVGLTWLLADENEVSVGWSSPLSGDRNFDSQFLFNFIRHL